VTRHISGTTWGVEDAKAYIMDRVHQVPWSGCWLWDAQINAYGYGQGHVPRGCVNGGPRGRKAHRLAYEAFVGPLPDEMLICHRCDVRACCNPDHLFLGTHADNSADMTSKGRQARGQKQGHAALCAADVITICNAVAAGVRRKDLAAAYGVGAGCISKLARGQRWQHIDRQTSVKDGRAGRLCRVR
jgi:hypothetical protein